MAEINDKYDHIGEFYQGVAIVIKNDKYGAIMIGGKEIVPPIYEELSEFKDGYAVAKWNNEERIVNLSGQIRVSKDDKEIYLPEEYDWGFDFIEDICVVVKNDKYGIIDSYFNVKLECEYDSFSNYHNGYGVFSKYRESKWSDDVWVDNFLIDNNGKVQYKIKESFADGHKIVRCIDDQQNMYGVMDSNMQIIIPVKYSKINRLKSGFYVADSTGNTKSFFHPAQGNLICEKEVDSVYDYLKDLNQNFFVIYQKDKTTKDIKTSIYSSPEFLHFSFSSDIPVEADRDGCIIFEYDNHKFRYDSEGNLYIVSTRYVSYPGHWETIVVRKVKKEYLNFTHKSFPITSHVNKYEIIENENQQKGISDLVGNILIEPQYNDIYPFTEDLFIVSTDSNRKFGIVDIYNSIKVPFDFHGLTKINDKFLAYTDRPGSALSLPSYKSNSYYLNIYFGILDVNGNKITEPLFSSITFENLSSTFIVGIERKYGVVDTKGQYILRCLYDTIEYNINTCNFTFGISCGNKTGVVSLDGFHIVKDAQENIIKVPTDIIDWCGDFDENNIADVIKFGSSGHINKFNQFVSFFKDKEFIMPSRYDFIQDFICGYAPVLLGGKYGILNTKLELIIPCEYEYIEALSDSLFKFREGSRWGVTDISRTIIVNADYETIVSESESLIKIGTYLPNGSLRELRYGLLDCKGNIIIPAECKSITRIEEDNNIFFVVEKEWQKGVLDKNGNIIVPFIYDYISESGSPFYCVCRNKFHSFYKSNGERYICIDIDKDCSKKVTIPAGYEYAAYVGYGIVKVSQSDKWGLIDVSGNIITEPQYSSIDIIDGSFAKVGKCLEEKITVYGFIDTSGEVVTPIEYDKIEKWDNGYYMIQKNELYGLLSPTLHLVFAPSKNYMKKLDDKYILVRCAGICSAWGLIDYYGNEVIPADGEHYSFSEIEVLENGFLKAIYHKSAYVHQNQYTIGILNSKGKEIYRKFQCEDIIYFGDGLFLVKEIYGNVKNYRLINLQGKELFGTYYNDIEDLKNGSFLIYKNNRYGIANNTGKIVIQPKYKNKVVFENGFAKIKVEYSDQEHKIDADGYVFLLDSNKNEIRIPRDYYWGTDFIHGISIVRTTKDSYGNDTIGVINEAGDVIIPAKYDSIELLSDNTLLVKKDNKYGLYDITGNCILPDIFTSIEHISKDRIRVIWNLIEIQSWSPGEYTPNLNNDLGSRENDLVNNRSALCDTKGNIISDKRFVCVGKFLNGYARCYLNIEAEKGNIKLKNTGIIDTNGKTIVNPEYDGIILYNHSFARLRKGNKYGIADLNNKKTIFFDEINIKKPGDIDSFGRFIYTDGEYHNEQTNNKGVMGPNGIILSPGEYYHIDLLENGLIKVSNKEQTLFGLLGVDGKELFKMEYSYISPFEYGHASVCIGGHEEDKYPYRHAGGKWGIIDKTGKFIIKCINDQRQSLSAKDIINYNLIDESEFDSYGRLLHVGPCEYKSDSNKTIIGRGVIGLKGIIVPTGKYPNIDLLENGLMMVSNEQKELFGILGSDGRELLEMKYSYISPFEKGLASICIGGHNQFMFPFNEHVGGKWGVIDKTGKIVIECIHDKDQIENLYETIVIDSLGISECDSLNVLSSDSIPSDIEDEDCDDYNDEYYSDADEDDNPSIYDNPYYNDNIDMDQQSIEFWNSI